MFQAKLSLEDEMLSELIELEEEVKVASKRIHEIREWCKAQGSFCTEFYVCSVQPRSRTGIAALDKVVKALGRDILEEHELISTSSFSVISVTRKGMC